MAYQDDELDLLRRAAGHAEGGSEGSYLFGPRRSAVEEPVDDVGSRTARLASFMREEIEHGSKINASITELAASTLEAFGMDRAFLLHMAGASPEEAAAAAQATRQYAGEHPFTAGLAGKAGGAVGMLYPAGKATKLLGGAKLAAAAEATVGGASREAASRLFRESVKASAKGFAAYSGGVTAAGAATSAIGEGRELPLMDTAFETGKATVIGAAEGAAFPFAGRVTRAIGSKAARIQPGVRPSAKQAVTRKLVEDSLLFSGIEAVHAEGDIGDRAEAALQGAILGPLVGATHLHRELVGRRMEGLPRTEAQRGAVALVNHLVRTDRVADVEKYLKSSGDAWGPIATEGLRYIGKRRARLEALEPKPESVGRVKHDWAKIAEKPDPKVLEDDPKFAELMADSKTPDDFKAWAERKLPGWLLPAEPETVRTTKERESAEAIEGLLMGPLRMAGASAISTPRGTLLMWPDLVRSRLTEAGSESRTILEQRLGRSLDGATFTMRGLHGAVIELAKQDALGEVLGHPVGHATKGKKPLVVTWRDEEGYEVRTVATNPGGRGAVTEAIKRWAGKRGYSIDLRHVAHVPTILAERQRPYSPRQRGNLPAKASEPKPPMEVVVSKHQTEDAALLAFRDLADKKNVTIRPLADGQFALARVEVKPETEKAPEPQAETPGQPPPGPSTIEPTPGQAPPGPSTIPQAPPGLVPPPPEMAPPPPAMTPMTEQAAPARPSAPRRRDKHEALDVVLRDPGALRKLEEMKQRGATDTELRELVEGVAGIAREESAAVVPILRNREQVSHPLERRTATPAEPPKGDVNETTRDYLLTENRAGEGRIELRTSYATVDASDVQASFTPTLQKNPRYPQALQNRLVSEQTGKRIGDLASWIKSKKGETVLEMSQTPADGPPVVWVDTSGEVGKRGAMYVVAGNHRWLALGHAIRTGFPEYADRMGAMAERLGIEAGEGDRRLVRLVRNVPFEKIAQFIKGTQGGSSAEETKVERSIGEAQRLKMSGFSRLTWVPGDSGLSPTNIVEFLERNSAFANKLFPRGFEAEGLTAEGATRVVNDALVGSLPRNLLEAINRAGDEATNVIYEIAPMLHRYAALSAEGKLRPEMDPTPHLPRALEVMPEAMKLVGASKKAIDKAAFDMFQLRLGGERPKRVWFRRPGESESDYRAALGIASGFAYERGAPGYFTRKLSTHLEERALRARQASLLEEPAAAGDIVASMFTKGHAAAVDKLIKVLGDWSQRTGRATAGEESEEVRREAGPAEPSTAEGAVAGAEPRPSRPNSGASVATATEQREREPRRGDAAEPAGAGEGRELRVPAEPPAKRTVIGYTPDRRPDRESVPRHLRAHLTEDQQDGAAMAISAMETGLRGALIADGTGFGKTRQLFAVAEHFRSQGAPVLIVAPPKVLGKEGSKLGVHTSYGKDSRIMGVHYEVVPKDGVLRPGKIYVSTYHHDTVKKIAAQRDTVLILDEMQNIKNAESGRSQAMQPLLDNARSVLFTSATPNDRIAFLNLKRIGILEGQPEEVALPKLGWKLVDVRDRETGQVVGQKWDVDRAFRAGGLKGYPAVIYELNRLFDRIGRSGRAIKREIAFDGVTVESKRVGIDAAARADLAKIVGAFGETSPVAVMHLRRYLERAKVAEASQIALKEYQDGRSVIVFVENVNERDITKKRKRWVQGGEPIVEDVPIGVKTGGSAQQVHDLLVKAGVPNETIVHLHGEVKEGSEIAAFAEEGLPVGAAAKAIEQFQRNDARVMIATTQSGGVGLNLDDVSGRHPRSLVLVTTPWAGDQFMQAMGRVWRLSTQSAPRVFPIYTEHPTDLMNVAIVVKKLATLAASVKGETVKFQEIMSSITGDEAAQELLAIVKGRRAAEKAERKRGQLPYLEFGKGSIESRIMADFRRAWTITGEGAVGDFPIYNREAARRVVATAEKAGLKVRLDEARKRVYFTKEIAGEEGPKEAPDVQADRLHGALSEIAGEHAGNVSREALERTIGRLTEESIRGSQDVDMLERAFNTMTVAQARNIGDPRANVETLRRIYERLEQLNREGKRPC